MGKLQSNRPLLGNIGLVVFLALLVTLTFGTVPQAQAATPEYDEDLAVQVTTDKPLAVQDKDGKWQTGEATLYTNKDKNQVEITFQILTDQSFESLFFKILKDGITVLDSVYLKELTNVVYKTYDSVYHVYQVVYTWVYSGVLDLYNDYTLVVYAGDGQQLASITLDLEAPPPEPSGGGAAPAPAGTTVDTGTVTVKDGQGTLTVDAEKVEKLVANPEVKAIEFAIPADVAKEGVVVLPAAVLVSVFEAGKPAVFKVADVQLTIDPADLNLKDLQTLAEEGAKINVSIDKTTAPVPAALKVASDIYEIRIDVVGADGVRKGSIDSFAKPITLTLPFDPEKLQGVSEDLLSVFRYNEKAGQWDLVPGSRVDKKNNTVSVESYHLSKYAVMAYEAAFADIIGHWAEADIKLMAAKGIVKGMTATTFAPEAQVTRAQFATLLVKALNIREQAATGTRFTDVPATSWFASTVETAAANGLIKGYPDGSFRPNAKITRQELAAMVANALKFRGRDAESLTAAEVDSILSTFADRSQISSWARTAAAVVVKNGIVKGRAVDEFAPLATAKRCEAVVMIKQMLSFLGEL
jgi:hypothetical protein